MNEASADLERSLTAMDRTVSEMVTYFRNQVTAESAAWGPKEVLCHLLAWHRWTLDGFNTVRAGGPPPRQAPTMAEIDAFNARAIEERSGRDTADLTNELADLQRQLVAAARALPDPTVIVTIRMNGDELTAPQRLDMMNHHFGNHLAEMRRETATAS